MDDNQNNNQPTSQETTASRKITTKVTCPHCGKDYETEVEVQEPEKEAAPKTTWIT